MKDGRACRLHGATLVLIALALAACASSPRRESPPPRDRTQDPEFVAAVAAAEPEFETQADALAAGVYEPFVHPDSVRPAAPPSVAPSSPPEFGPGDPSTEELLGTLNRDDTYHDKQPQPPFDEAVRDPEAAIWTLQVGAFGAETGALVRLRQLARDFPDLPRWHRVESGLFRVYLGRFSDRGDAERVHAVAVERGYADAWVLAAP